MIWTVLAVIGWAYLVAGVLTGWVRASWIMRGVDWNVRVSGALRWRLFWAAVTAVITVLLWPDYIRRIVRYRRVLRQAGGAR